MKRQSSTKSDGILTATAITANDDDKIINACGALIRNGKTAGADCLKALMKHDLNQN